MPHGDAVPGGGAPAWQRQGGGDKAGRAACEGRPPVPRSGAGRRRRLASPAAGSIPSGEKLLATTSR